MLTIVTGTPGSGKTLWAISEVLRLQKDSGRPVYYYNIKGITHDDWHAIDDPERWADTPQGALILMDETWEYFESNASNPRAPVPDALKPLATHRHDGHDVFLVTQHSTQIHTFVRKMAGRHVHLVRRFGVNGATRFEWPESVDEKDGLARSRADKSLWKYPKDLFGTYTSTVLDTVERRLPWKRFAAIFSIIALIPLAIMLALNTLGEDEKPTIQETDDMIRQEFQRGFASLSAALTIQNRRDLYEPETWQPEIEGVPYSAKFYDELITPADYPRITGCMRHTWSDGTDTCTCTDQQGNIVDVPYFQCREHVRKGIFDFSRVEKQPVNNTSTAPAATGRAGGGAPSSIFNSQ